MMPIFNPPNGRFLEGIRGKYRKCNKDYYDIKRINQISFFLPYHRLLMGLTRKSWMTIAGSTQPSTFVASTKARTSESELEGFAQF